MPDLPSGTVTFLFTDISAAFIRSGPQERETLFREALAVLWEVGYQSDEAMTLGNLGEVLLEQGQQDAGEVAIRESLTLRFAQRNRTAARSNCGAWHAWLQSRVELNS